MSRLPIDSIDDPRVAIFRDLPRQNLTRHSRRFIAEGDKVVERLIDSPFPVESLLVEEELADRFATRVPSETPIYVMPKPLLQSTVGFRFHRGVMACGVRQPGPTALELLATIANREAETLVVCPDVQDPTNLGSIIRTAAAFGCGAVILGGACADPFSRRVLRVSMAASLFLPIVESRDLPADLRHLSAGGFECVATVLDCSAEHLMGFRRHPRTAIMLGSEGHGLSDRWLAHCQRQVTIPMHAGIDSLNVAVAAAILMWQLSQ